MRSRHVAPLIEAVLRRGGWVRGVRRAEAVLAWPRVVGPEVARFADAVALTNGTLIVEVGDAETAMHLGLQRQHILDAYRALPEGALVRDLRFRVGRPPAAPAAVPAPPPSVDADELSALVAASQGLPDPLAAAAASAGRSLAVLRARRRAAGWRACDVCGSLTEPSTPGGVVRCATCRRQLASRKVRAAATLLSLEPDASTPALTEDERRAARSLAEEHAQARIASLVPLALSDPGTAAVLAVAVRCAVALRRGVGLGDVLDLDDVDPVQDGVDARALRALGRHRPKTPEVP